MTPRALLDANVVYSIRVTDLLLTLAEHGLFEPMWSDEILAEALEALLRVPGRDDAAVRRRFDSMNGAFPDARVTGYGEAEDTLELPDPKDRHVLAAAIVGRAPILLTWNGKHFPQEKTVAHGVSVRTPDDFMLMLLAADSDSVLSALFEVIDRLENPPLTLDMALDNLAGEGCDRFVSKVRSLLSVVPFGS
jgi:predicted nucleic acid-binding protein